MREAVPSCRVCGQTELAIVLSLGRVPLANALLTAEQLASPEPTYPLDVAFCSSCTLIQITETIPPAQLFREYLYFSSFATTQLRHAKALVERLIETRHLTQRSLVIEVASNDGYLLQYYRQANIPVLGIEPAANVAKVAREQRGIPTLCEFFGEGLAQQLRQRGQRAEVLHAHNVLAHVEDLNGFMRGLSLLLKEEGVVVIEVPYVKDMLDRCEFDTIYHEHLCYFSLTALDRLVRRHGLMIADVERVVVHGGSLRLTLQAASTHQAPGASVQRLLQEEAAWGVDRVEVYREFASRVESLKGRLRAFVKTIKQQGGRLAAYGAPAKGNTLLNYCGLGSEWIEYTVDQSPYKQGRFLPGTHIPIHDPGRLRQTKPDYILILPWNLKEEIIEQHQYVREWGGKFVVPIPGVEVLA